MNRLYEVLVFEEGMRTDPYVCSEGYVTIGIGTKLHNSPNIDPRDFCLRVSEKAARALLEDEVDRIRLLLASELDGLDVDVQTILLSMAYQMGVRGLLGFRKMWAALKAGDRATAAYEALDSQWARQTPARANRHADVISGIPLSQVYP